MQVVGSMGDLFAPAAWAGNPWPEVKLRDAAMQPPLLQQHNEDSLNTAWLNLAACQQQLPQYGQELAQQAAVPNLTRHPQPPQPSSADPSPASPPAAGVVALNIGHPWGSSWMQCRDIQQPQAVPEPHLQQPAQNGAQAFVSVHVPKDVSSLHSAAAEDGVVVITDEVATAAGVTLDEQVSAGVMVGATHGGEWKAEAVHVSGCHGESSGVFAHTAREGGVCVWCH